jgi:AraC family transcriptional regulator of adaptative response / DNA-3-methyladenine glycosylase II
VIQLMTGPALPSADICERALDARDPRFDGVFFVGITTTHIYCRTVCPARVSYTDRRRFFATAAAAERAGFRPCLRCRPELAPGRAPMDAVPRLARLAADRIGAGALNGRGVAQLADDLGVSERHLRRALEREIGVSPLELAQTHRLLLAKQLLMDTTLSITRIAFASGFQSLRRFNAVFRERYRLSPSALRGARRQGGVARASGESSNDLIRLTLAYRPPLAWEALVHSLTRLRFPGVETRQEGRYARTVCLDGRAGIVLAEDAAGPARNGHGTARSYLNVHLSTALLPVLMPLLARLRRYFDLDAEPTMVDAHLTQGGLGRHVEGRPGVRIPGVLDGFEAVLRTVLSESPAGARAAAGLVSTLGEPIATDVPGLTHLMPSAARVADTGPAGLVALGLSPCQAAVLSAVARAMTAGRIRLEPGGNVAAARRALLEVEGVDGRLATLIAMRALYWPDAFPGVDPALQRAAGLTSPVSLEALAERWRPWRAYAAHHLWLEHTPETPEQVLAITRPKPARQRRTRLVSSA